MWAKGPRACQSTMSPTCPRSLTTKRLLGHVEVAVRPLGDVNSLLGHGEVPVRPIGNVNSLLGSSAY